MSNVVDLLSRRQSRGETVIHFTSATEALDYATTQIRDLERLAGTALVIAASDLELPLAQGEVKRADSTSRPNPMVVVEAIAPGAVGGVAEPGSVLTANVDAAAVAVGDTLVVSSSVNGSGKADNTITDPRLIIGQARTSKAAGSSGTVKVYIR